MLQISFQVMYFGLQEFAYPHTVLELTGDLPEDIELDRWFGEPLKAIVLPTSIFLTNKKGFPVLSKKHQAIVQRFFSVTNHTQTHTRTHTHTHTHTHVHTHIQH